MPFDKLIGVVLSLVANGRAAGVDIKSGELFRIARRACLWPQAEPVHRSSITKARGKIAWEVFKDLLKRSVQLAYELWPQESKYSWHGMSVFAIDGSKYDLPATSEIRREFDPKSGLHHDGKGHFPQCLVSTLYDVFRRIPVARTIMEIGASERDQVEKFLPCLPKESVWLFDRGYPAFGLLAYLMKAFSGYFVFRCPASHTFPAVETFMKSGRKQDYLYITPSNKYLAALPAQRRKGQKPIKLRVIRLEAPDGTLSVLLTNLPGEEKFPMADIIALYFRRWEIELYFRDEKITMELERFHAQTSNGIRQELFAAMIVTVITRTLMAVISETHYGGEREFQFKNALTAVSAEIAVFIPEHPEKGLEIFKELLIEISRVVYYRPKNKRPSQPRVTKSAVKKWSESRLRRIARVTNPTMLSPAPSPP